MARVGRLAVALLAAGVLAVPVFKRIGLGSVLGYLAAGLAIGPFGLKLFREPETILHVAEFGVVIFLFIIGLEMRPKRLWGLRKEIFGLGAAQVLFCGLILTLTAMLAGFSAPVAFVGAMGFVLSSTAVHVIVAGARIKRFRNAKPGCISPVKPVIIGRPRDFVDIDQRIDPAIPV